MNIGTEVEVTLSRTLYRRLMAEARRLELPLEWVVASLVVDTFEPERTPARDPEPAAA